MLDRSPQLNGYPFKQIPIIIYLSYLSCQSGHVHHIVTHNRVRRRNRALKFFLELKELETD